MTLVGWRNRIVGMGEEAPDQLVANPANWRTHPGSQRDALRGSLSTVGWVQQVLVNRTTGHVVDGHARVEEALSRHEATVPVLYVELEPDEEALILATLDPIGAMAERDEERLRELLADISVDDPGLERLLADLAPDEPKAGLTDPDEVPDIADDSGIKRGDLFALGDHRLMCGDSTDAGDVGRLMGGAKADCVFTSPPYAVGVDYGAYEDTLPNLRAMLAVLPSLWRESLVSGGFVVINFGDIISGGDPSAVGPCEYPMALEYWAPFRAADFVLWSRRAWCKPTPRVHSPWCIQSNRAASDWEHVWTWKAPGDAIVARVDGADSSVNGWLDTTHDEGVAIGKKTHGAGMAASIARKMVAVHSRQRAVVYEPFDGTGTTIIAAEETGRRCYAMEIDPRYVAVAIKRWEQFTGRMSERLP